MTTINQRIVERIPLEVLNNGDMGILDEIMAVDYLGHATPLGVPSTREGFKQTVIGLKTAFPDLHDIIDDSMESGIEFPTRVERAGFRAAWDALEAAAGTLEGRIAAPRGLGIGVVSAVAAAKDARGRLETLRDFAPSEGQRSATA